MVRLWFYTKSFLFYLYFIQYNSEKISTGSSYVIYRMYIPILHKTPSTVTKCSVLLQSFSKRRSIERRSKAQEWARARAHLKYTERKRKLALIFALKIIQFLIKLVYEIQLFYHILSQYFFNFHSFLLWIVYM